MIKLKVLLLSKSKKAACCQAIDVSYKHSKVIAAGNVKIGEVLEIGSVHHTNFLSCKTKTISRQDKEYTWLLLENPIDNRSAEINYLIFENKIQLVNEFIKTTIINKKNNFKRVLIEIVGSYSQYLYSNFNIDYSIYYEPVSYNDEELGGNVIDENVCVDLESVYNDRPYLEPYESKLSNYGRILHQMDEDIEIYDLCTIVRENDRIKVYNLNSLIEFGKFSSKTVIDVLVVNPKYLLWCILNLEHFAVTTTIIMAISSFGIQVDEKGLLVNLFKLKMKYFQDDARRIYRQKSYYEKKIDQAYLNDGMNEAFNGDPTNLWNID